MRPQLCSVVGVEEGEQGRRIIRRGGFPPACSGLRRGPRKRSSLYMRHCRKRISGSPLPDLAPDNIPLALVQPRPGVDLSLCSVLVGALVVSARCGNLPPPQSRPVHWLCQEHVFHEAADVGVLRSGRGGERRHSGNSQSENVFIKFRSDQQSGAVTK